jgi:hypothetical protein
MRSEVLPSSTRSRPVRPWLPVTIGSAPRSFRELSAYEMEARDGGSGRLEDLVADDSSWTLRFVVVDTRAWLPVGMVLVPTGSIEAVDPSRQRVITSLTGDEIKNDP